MTKLSPISAGSLSYPALVMAHETRCGRRQHEWLTEDWAAFAQHLHGLFSAAMQAYEWRRESATLKAKLAAERRKARRDKDRRVPPARGLMHYEQFLSRTAEQRQAHQAQQRAALVDAARSGTRQSKCEARRALVSAAVIAAIDHGTGGAELKKHVAAELSGLIPSTTVYRILGALPLPRSNRGRKKR